MAEPQRHHLGGGYNPPLCGWSGALPPFTALAPGRTTLAATQEKQKHQKGKTLSAQARQTVNLSTFTTLSTFPSQVDKTAERENSEKNRISFLRDRQGRAGRVGTRTSV